MRPFPFFCRILSAIACLLFTAPVLSAAEEKPDQASAEVGVSGTQPDTPSAFTPEAPPKACRDCGLRYYRPPDVQSEAVAPAASSAPSKIPSDVPVSAVPGRSHLSSDPRIRTARVLVKREPLPRGPGDPAARWPPLTIRIRRTCNFSWAWPPCRWFTGCPMSKRRNGSRCWTRPSRRSGPF